MAKHNDIPTFGNLSGLTVLSTGAGVAGPFCANLMAENGADVITVVNPEMEKMIRSSKNLSWASVQDKRNQRNLSLNIPSPQGREVFLRLIKQADILIDGSRGGTFDKWGLGDAVLWEVNPALVIVHISGFGQSGVKEYVERPSWDGIGQAFSGYMYLNGYPDPEPPMRVSPLNCDYVTALFACWSALAAIIKAKQTGQGDSIDIAQYEVMLRISSDYPAKYLNDGKQIERNGNTDSMMTGYYPYKCKDGKYIFTAWVGVTAIKKGLPLLGFQVGSEDFPNPQVIIQGTPGSKKFDETFRAWCLERTAEEAEKELVAAGVPVSQIMNYEAAVNHPHYQAREVFVEWEDPEKGPVKGVGFIPKFTRHPGQIWRGAPEFNTDTGDILEELGYSEDEVRELAESRAIADPIKTPEPVRS